MLGDLARASGNMTRIHIKSTMLCLIISLLSNELKNGIEILVGLGDF